MNNLKPAQKDRLLGIRRKAPTEMVFEDGFKLALPDNVLRGNNGLNQEYRLVDIVAVPKGLEEDIKPGDCVVLHELESLPLDKTDPNSPIIFCLESVLAIAEWIPIKEKRNE